MSSGFKLSTQDVINRLSFKKIVLMGEYRNAKTKSLLRCEKGHKWSALVDGVFRGVGCPHCSRNARLSTVVVNDKIADRGLKMLGEYKTARTKSLFKCERGHEWMATPDNVLRRSGCPHCVTRFNLDEPVTFYVFYMARAGIEGVGFGIASVFENRLMDHKTVFKKTNTDATLLLKIHFRTRYEAMRLELRIKEHPAIMDFGIKGFRTECLPLDYKDYLLSQIFKYAISV